MLHRKKFSTQEVIDFISLDFFNEAYCRKWILERLHPGGPACPGCGDKIQGPAAVRFWDLKKVKCKACGCSFTGKTGTNLWGLKIDCREVVLFSLLVEAGYSMAWIEPYFNVSRRTLYLYKQRFQGLPNKGDTR